MDNAAGMPEVCEYHKPDAIDYLTFFRDAERREKLGQKQTQCPDCKRWFWRHELGKKPHVK